MKSPQMVYTNYPLFFQFVFNCIVSDDSSLVGIALDTIGIVGSTDEGLNILFQSDAQRNILTKIGSFLQSSEEQLRYN